MVYSLYYSLATNYANVDVLAEIVWSAKVSFYLGPSVRTGRIDGLVQLEVVVGVSSM
jgi:hypothetical protein